MASDTHSGVEQLLETPDLADALDSDQFKLFLDQVPVAIAVAELNPTERVIYANHEFGRLTGQANSEIVGGSWERLPGHADAAETARPLAQAVAEERDYLGVFTIVRPEAPLTVDAWSNIIEGDDGRPMFRLVALVESAGSDSTVLDELQASVQEKDIQLRELQHRVKNNLQMITALIRVEARGVADRTTGEGFDRLAGRVEALGLLYHSLAAEGSGDSVDLGIYLSEIASAVMRAHAVEGIRLEMKVDTWPVSVDVAMPAGLVVNELMTNSLKHAFAGRGGGTITLQSTTDPRGCRVLVADDGIGLPEGMTWPKPGKLSALIVRSLEQNARATMEVDSAPGAGTRVTIDFRCEDAVPSA
ncbi:MAG: histidine kinase [Phenylobacterium sp.]|nr:histidine kinase [Phenylobacterium sp.]